MIEVLHLVKTILIKYLQNLFTLKKIIYVILIVILLNPNINHILIVLLFQQRLVKKK